MAWLTREDSRLFSQTPQEPDMETLTYWVQRLEPLIRAEKKGEIIVIFCNRTGNEDDVFYAGTSAVLGIKEGEVNVYGLLGRGVKELLVVDTDAIPYAQLVQRPDNQAAVPASPTAAPSQSPVPSNPESQGSIQSSDVGASKGGSSRSSEPRAAIAEAPESQNTKALGLDTAQPSSGSTRKQRPTPRITIPQQPTRYSRQGQQRPTSMVEDSPTIPTPTAPSPPPLSMRPHVELPWAPPAKGRTDAPYLRDDPPKPAEESDSQTPEFFRIPADQMFQTPEESRRSTSHPEASTGSLAALVKIDHGVQGNGPNAPRAAGVQVSLPQSDESLRYSETEPMVPISRRERTTPRPDSRTSRSTKNRTPRQPESSSRSRAERRASELDDRTEFADISRRPDALGRRSESAVEARSSRAHDRERISDRRPSPKSRNASRSRPAETEEPAGADRAADITRACIPIVASPSILLSTLAGIRAGQRFPVDEGIGRRPLSRSRAQSNMDDPSQARSGTAGTARQPQHAARSPEDSPYGRVPSRSRQPRAAACSRRPSQSRAVSRGRLPGDAMMTPPARAHSAAQDWRSSSRPVTKEDEIIAVIEFDSGGCRVEGVGLFPQDIGSSGAAAAEISSTPPTPTPGATSTTSAAVSDTCPTIGGCSVQTVATPREPPTPLFDPKTPKAMVFNLKEVQEAVVQSDGLTPPKLETLKTNKQHLIVDMARPKSAVW